MFSAPEERAAAQYIVGLSSEIEVQLSKGTGGGPVLELLKLARAEAAEAIAMLAEADPETPAGIRQHQNRIVCFRLICDWLKRIVAAGYDAGAELDDDNREDLAEAIGLSPDEADEAMHGGLLPAETD